MIGSCCWQLPCRHQLPPLALHLMYCYVPSSLPPPPPPCCLQNPHLYGCGSCKERRSLCLGIQPVPSIHQPCRAPPSPPTPLLPACRDQKIVLLEHNQTITDGLKTLAKNNILSAPLVREGLWMRVCARAVHWRLMARLTLARAGHASQPGCWPASWTPSLQLPCAACTADSFHCPFIVASTHACAVYHPPTHPCHQVMFPDIEEVQGGEMSPQLLGWIDVADVMRAFLQREAAWCQLGWLSWFVCRGAVGAGVSKSCTPSCSVMEAGHLVLAGLLLVHGRCWRRRALCRGASLGAVRPAPLLIWSAPSHHSPS